MCAACQYGKQKRKPSPGKKSTVVKDRDGALKKDNLFPGQRVSVDHFVCSTKGRLLHTFGKEDSTKQFTGGAIFVDHATGYIFVEHQVHLNTHETLKGKERFEQTCRDFGVVVTEYLSDYGSIFTSGDYTTHLRDFAQIQNFAGVGAHHHNGVAERSIQTVMSIARTMMLHQAIHWPDVATATLWPLAVDHAVYLYNHMPNPANGLSPHDLMTKTRWPQSQLADCHVWGCPVYVLDKTISDGKKLPRWKPRSTRQIFVGMSKKHASSVPLCLNPNTGAITSQFHVVFDDSFTTVASSEDNLPDFGSDEWNKLFGESVYQYVLDPDDEEDVPEIPSDQPSLPTERVRQQTELLRPSVPLPVVPPSTSAPAGGLSNRKPSTPQREQPFVSPLPQFEQSPTVSQPAPPQRETIGATPRPTPRAPRPAPSRPTSTSRPSPPRPSPAPAPSSSSTPALRRSTRSTRGKLPQRYANNVTVGYYTGYDHHFCQFLHANNVEGRGCLPLRRQ